MDVVIPAVQRRAQCVLWLSGQCRYTVQPECPCRTAAKADDEAAEKTLRESGR